MIEAWWHQPAAGLAPGQLPTWSQLNSFSSCGAQTKRRHGGGEGEQQRRWAAGGEEVVGGWRRRKGGGRKRGQNGRKCVSEQVISRKQITLKRNQRGGTLRSTEKGGGGGDTHQHDAQKNPKRSQIIAKTKRAVSEGAGAAEGSPEAWWRRSGTPSQRGSSTRYWWTAGHRRRHEGEERPHCPPPDGCRVSDVRSHRASAGRSRRAGQRHHLLDGEPQLQPVQRVADADLPLDLRVRQVGHDGAALHVSATCSHVPGGHAHPQLQGQRQHTLALPAGAASLSVQEGSAPPARRPPWARPRRRREALGDRPPPAARAWGEEEAAKPLVKADKSCRSRASCINLA